MIGVSGEWHHFIYHKVGNQEEMFVDGKKLNSFIFGVYRNDYEILNFSREQVGCIVEEEFWFRNKNNVKNKT